MIVSNSDLKVPIEFTATALDKIASSLKESPSSGFLALRISIMRKGCGGNSYNMQICNKKEDYDDLFVVPHNGEYINILVDKKAFFYLVGTKIDYLQNKLESGFVFYNQKEKGRCGCGESFYT